MRAVRQLTAMIVCLGLFAGCSSTPNDAAPSGNADPGFAPATIATKFGDVTISSRPTKVVALGWGDAETALAMGIQPIAASDWVQFGGAGVGPWATGKYSRPPKIIGTLDPNYEEIASLRPDLILDVKGSGDEGRHSKLAAIAPTIGIPQGADNYKTTQEQQVDMVARALGTPDKGQRLLTDLNAKIAGIKAAHPNWQGRTVSAIARSSGGWGAYVPGAFRLDLLLRLGFVPNPKITALANKANNFSVVLSEEQLGLADADAIIGYPVGVQPSAITDSLQWRTIPAVAQGRSVIVNPDYSKAYALGSILSTGYALDRFVPELEKASH
ncbi:ABC transporter substrate-binding protein [Tsukamurella sp. 8F]|uniref:iron-siderophore ABC transporter substrate-binding protein n=1 Tax=unclassified Tsukamurella TaxID=2633480 RepID=UPI0023B887E4|nr:MULTISPECIES: ABC transporter substrate-binding protein [unclassified Tsukamurella]MDF0529724.1 ABC transporter substrate-binding protein [Tsukamurella sp. 8J]MDF0586009.1 ABC transporter substrate-binding protein [Tsukamurella sp. 8F]